jgi:CheY-like chemotaxis protein
MTSVLVIEDEPNIRHNIVETLSYEGYETLEAENGNIGMQVTQQHRPDLIICDVMMPELDGYEVLRQLQSEPATATIPFIFLTALADRQHVRYGMQLGADDYLTKPFTHEELLGTIHTRLTKHATTLHHYQSLTNVGANGSSVDSVPYSQSLVGTFINGYQIGNIIGEGGVGTVYQAYQPSIGREVAIKVLRQKYVNNTEFIRRFQTEAELVARLEHPHIIPLYDYWHDANGVYIVMRWLRGGSLRDVLHQHGALNLSQSIHLMDQIAEALTVAHSVGIIHRDIKPDNILLDERGNAYLTDFGIAKNVLSGDIDISQDQNLEALLKAQDDFFRQELAGTLYITDAEQTAGTPAYLSPEQIRSEPLSMQSDIYNLGITLYEMLTGQQPFVGTMGEIIVRQLLETLPSLRVRRPDLPAYVDEVIQKATAKNWQDRYADVLAFAEDFCQSNGRP